VLVKDLSERFGVTEDSIRKDLAILQKRGLLRKTYGGAVKARVIAHEILLSQRLAKNPEGKRVMAEKALRLIKDGDVIFLDISTANIDLAKKIAEANMPITVVTNMIGAMSQLVVDGRFKLVFIGGALSDGKDGFVGASASREMRKFRFDSAFMGAAGVDLDDGSVYTFMPEDGATKQVAMECSRKPYLMLESRKLTADGNYRYAKMDDFTGSIMDEKPEGLFDAMGGYSVEWI
jgi:DeoR family glycerol-3-phosphate regulon repressor